MSKVRCPHESCGKASPQGLCCVHCGGRLEDAAPILDEEPAALEAAAAPESDSSAPVLPEPSVLAPTPNPMEGSAGVGEPSTVQLTMDTGARPRVGAAGNSWFGLVNLGRKEVDCHLVVEVPREHRDCFPGSGGRWVRWTRVAPGASEVLALSFMAHTAGEFPLSIRLFVEMDDGHGRCSFFQVPMASRPHFQVSGAPGGGSITVTNTMKVGTNYAGDLIQRPVLGERVIEQIREQMQGGQGQGSCDPIQLPLSRPQGVSGCHPPAGSSFGRQTWRVDLSEKGAVVRRVYLLAQDELWFGRNDQVRGSDGRIQRNDLAWRWLPCRSAEVDPEHFRRNRTISRFHIGAVRASEERTSLVAGRSGLVVDGRSHAEGEEDPLMSASSRLVELGSPPLSLKVTALKVRSSGQAFSWLQEAHSLGGRSGRIDTAFRHDAVLVERLNNLPEVAYLLLLRRASLGGHREDTLRWEGLPPRGVRFARFGGSVFVLSGETERWWRPVSDGMAISLDDDRSVRIDSATVEQTKLEADLVKEGETR